MLRLTGIIRCSLTYINRLKLLWKLILSSSKAREIELEWQSIQQDAHNVNFSFQNGRSTDVDVAYKKGVVDGIKWSVNRFS